MISPQPDIDHAPDPTDIGQADAIYFLMFAGWATEMRGNRWHYATRWARHLPVVLVQPVLGSDDQPASWEAEPRIPNCRVLYVRQVAFPEGTMLGRFVQARQILSDMAEHGFRRPILWAYCPDYLLAYALVPAVARVYHATENFFSLDQFGFEFHDRLKCLLAISDLVVAVSEGVAQAQRPFARGRVEVVTNGCDYGSYSRGGVDAVLAGERTRWRKIAVYAGNINSRLDFDLVTQCAEACPDTLIALFGPVKMSCGEAAQWRRLLQRPNVREFGRVDVERLASIYATADVGLIPYRHSPANVDNLFPLKTFEMQAAGLPVVSTRIRALDARAGPGLRIASTAEDFVALVRATGRSLLNEGEREEITAASRAEDYDRKFDRVLAMTKELLAHAGPPHAPGAEMLGFFGGAENWLLALDRELAQLVLPRARLLAVLRSELRALLRPCRDAAARIMPSSWRRLLGRLWIYRVLFR